MLWLRNKIRGDRAGSELVSMLFIVMFFVPLMVSAMDLSFWFMNRSQIASAARDGARTIAIVGGTGTIDKATQLESSYGLPKSTCSGVSPTKARTPIECNVFNSIQKSRGLVSVSVDKVFCTPERTASVGHRVTCTVTYTYKSVPGSGLSIFRTSEGKTPLAKNVITGTSSSEVNMANTPLVPRK